MIDWWKSPCCDMPWQYRISVDAYVCPKCGTHRGPVVVEKDHVIYRTAQAPITCISCGSKTQPCCGH